MVKVWYLLPRMSASMPFQLALDEVLFRQSKETEPSERKTFLRFYHSSEPWVSVGYSFKQTNGRDAKVCRRITGGGRVEHGKDLIFSLISNREEDESFRSVRTSYWKIHEAVKRAFEHLGEAPRFYRCDENLPRGEDCFRYPIATDIAIGKHKVAGGAQKRSGGAMLHQESIQQPSGHSWEDLMTSIIEGFAFTFNVTFHLASIEPAWLREAKALAKSKYETEVLI